MLRTLTVSIALSCIAATPALAQTAPAPVTPPMPTTADAAMQVHLVRSGPPGCEPHCTEWIAAQGQINKDSLGQFKKVLGQLGNRRPPVLIHSAGGTVDDAIAIGRLIRAKGLDVAVTKTEFVPCAPADIACRKKTAKGGLIGTPKARLSFCASACPLILAGGVRRYVGPWTVLGVHQITSFQKHVKVLRTYQVTTRRVWGAPVEVKKTLIGEQKIAEKTVKTETTSSTYENVRQHFVAMGVDDSIMPMLMAAPSTTIRWLSRAELLQTHMATEIATTGEQLIAAAIPPKPELAAPDSPPDAAGQQALAAPSDRPAATPGTMITRSTPGVPALCALEPNRPGCRGLTITPPWARKTQPALAPTPPPNTSATVATPEVAAPAIATPVPTPTVEPAPTTTAQAAPEPVVPAVVEPPRPRKIEKPKRPAVAPATASPSPAYDFSQTR